MGKVRTALLPVGFRSGNKDEEYSIRLKEE
jgi:hypothetical protein